MRVKLNASEERSVVTTLRSCAVQQTFFKKTRTVRHILCPTLLCTRPGRC